VFGEYIGKLLLRGLLMDITGRLDGFMVRYRYRTTEAYTLHV